MPIGYWQQQFSREVQVQRWFKNAIVGSSMRIRAIRGVLLKSIGFKSEGTEFDPEYGLFAPCLGASETTASRRSWTYHRIGDDGR
ncbi:hypothetical protein EVAR_90413_1 [Eumeta japonica]|uniref:Uncharacterized protein n=1 Tax=Eumeta variegata TaxID=151549 RepID=A0A4C1YCW7_EUMVA|nr:hypothetical protein EVAR_90413_1 [Eumeta japonica]